MLDGKECLYYNVATMKPDKTIIIVRHGTTENNEKNIWQGRSDHPLNGKGKAEAQMLAERLANDHFDIIYHSPMTRAVQTAEIIVAGRKGNFQEVDAFVEIDMGDFDGMKFSDILEKYPDDYDRWVADINSPVPGGESFHQVFQRVKKGVNQILDSEEQNILIVGHAMVNRAIMGNMMKMNPVVARRFRMKNCAYSKLLVYKKPHGLNIVMESWNVPVW